MFRFGIKPFGGIIRRFISPTTMSHLMKFLVTGAAGFIGFYVCQSLCAAGHEVVGIDNLNDYYAVSLKEARLAELLPLDNFRSNCCAAWSTIR